MAFMLNYIALIFRLFVQLKSCTTVVAAWVCPLAPERILEVQSSTGKAVEAIGRITQRMGEIDDYASALAKSVQEQSIATGEISLNVTSAADGAKLVVTVLSEVTGAAAETQESAQKVLAASESVEKAAAEMRGEVESFLTKVAI